jgi:hypothetical protein
MANIKLSALGRQITQEQFESIHEELSSYGVQLRQLNAETFDALVEGRSQKGRVMQNEVNIKEYLKAMRQVYKLRQRAEKWKERLDVPAYAIRDMNELIFAESSKLQGITGYENYIATLKKVLKKDEVTGRNKIQESAYNTEQLRRIKAEAYDDPIELLENIDETFDRTKFVTSGGKFRSKQLEREFLKKFAQQIDDESFDNSQFEWGVFLQDKFGNDARSAYKNMNYDEKVEAYKEFKLEKINWLLIDAHGSETRYDYDITDEELEMQLEALTKPKKRRRK